MDQKTKPDGTSETGRKAVMGAMRKSAGVELCGNAGVPCDFPGYPRYDANARVDLPPPC